MIDRGGDSRAAVKVLARLSKVLPHFCRGVPNGGSIRSRPIQAKVETQSGARGFMSDFAKDIEQAPVVFFLGAGSSVPLGLPTTSTFWKDLKERPIEPQEAHDFLLQLEKELSDDGVLDIEVVLDKLLDWGKQAQQFASHPVSSRLANVLESLDKNVARQAHQAILSRVVDTYGAVHEYDAARLWTPIFEEIWNLGIRTVPVFTTNYDTVVEQATMFSADMLKSDRLNADYDYEGKGKYEHTAPEGYVTLRDGFRLGHREFASWNKWEFHGYDESPDQLTVVLFKMHGSVTWSFIPPNDHDEQVEGIDGGDEFDSSDVHVGLLAPGTGRDPLGRTTAVHYPYLTKSPPEHDIFSVPYTYFQSCLMNCKLCIAIGSSFRDESVMKTLIEGAMFRKGYALGRNKRGEPEWSKIGEGDLADLPEGLLRDREETDNLRVLTVAPAPDHLILQRWIRDHPEHPPIEVIPLETPFEQSSTSIIVAKIKELIGD